MKNLKVTFRGTTPILLNSCATVNPLHPISIERKEYTSKRKKTEEDLIKLAELDFLASMYYDKEIGVYIPAENIEATIINGGKNNKKGKDIQKYCRVKDFKVQLNYGENLNIDELKKRMIEFSDTRAVVVNRARVMKTRARFNNWEITFNYSYNEDAIDLKEVVSAIEYAGEYVGLCDYRARYGHFVSIIEELD